MTAVAEVASCSAVAEWAGVRVWKKHTLALYAVGAAGPARISLVPSHESCWAEGLYAWALGRNAGLKSLPSTSPTSCWAHARVGPKNHTLGWSIGLVTYDHLCQLVKCTCDTHVYKTITKNCIYIVKSCAYSITEDHVWFEDRWMAASLCDE
jgi:hypothetical protein